LKTLPLQGIKTVPSISKASYSSSRYIYFI
jgi:hypothetical protein